MLWLAYSSKPSGSFGNNAIKRIEIGICTRYCMALLFALLSCLYVSPEIVLILPDFTEVRIRHFFTAIAHRVRPSNRYPTTVMIASASDTRSGGL